MKIAFVGYMGSGKSFWANKLALEIGLQYIDLDSFLEENYLHSSVSDFIRDKGEIMFRKLEKQALLVLCESENDMVLSCGGGTPCYYNNMETLNDNFYTVYLNCTIKTLVSRLSDELSHRPLLNHLDPSELKEFVAKHLFERRIFYSQAKITLNENHFNMESLLKIIPTT